MILINYDLFETFKEELLITFAKFVKIADLLAKACSQTEPYIRKKKVSVWFMMNGWTVTELVVELEQWVTFSLPLLKSNSIA